MRSKRALELLLRAADRGIAVVAADELRGLVANEAFLQDLRLAPQEFEGALWRDLIATSPLELPADLRACVDRPVRVAGDPDGLEFELQVYPLRVDDEDLFLLEVRVSGAEAGVARPRGEARLGGVAAPEAQLSSEVDSFLYSVTHDLKTPVVSISGYVSMIQEYCSSELSDEALGYFKGILRNASRLCGLILQLEQLAALGKPPARNETVDLGEIVRTIVDELRSQLDAHNVSVEIEGDFPRLEGDPSRFYTIFNNLISNAVKYMGDQPAPRILVRCGDSGDHFLFEVTDNGIGIPPGWEEKVFLPFIRVKDVDCPGSGMGLAYTRQTVEKSGGRIWLRSRPRQGTTVLFTLPKEPLVPVEQ